MSARISGAAIATVEPLRAIAASLRTKTRQRTRLFSDATPEFSFKQVEIGDASRDFLQNWMDHYVAWVKTHVK